MYDMIDMTDTVNYLNFSLLNQTGSGSQSFPVHTQITDMQVN